MSSVTVKPGIRIGRDLRRDSDPFAVTRFGGISGFAVTIRCAAVVPPGQDNNPEIPENQNRDCHCQLDTVEVTASFEISLNPKKLNKSYFDWEKKEGYLGPRRGNDPELDEQNAMVHEMMHVNDATAALQRRIQEIVDRMDASSKTCSQPCKLRDRCRDAIQRVIETRLRTVAAREWSDLANTSISHSSELERNARQAQCDDFRNDPRTDGRRGIPRPSRDRAKKAATIGAGILLLVLLLLAVFQSVPPG